MVETDESDTIIREKCSACGGAGYIMTENDLLTSRGRVVGTKVTRDGCEACGWSGYEGGLPAREEMSPDELEATEHYIDSVASAFEQVYNELHPER